MTPFTYKTEVIDLDAKDKIGFLLVKGREDGSWSLNLHHWTQESSGCDTPGACWPAVLDTLAQWWTTTEARHNEGVRALLSWPDRRPGYRPGWRVREMNAAHQAFKKTMQDAGWPTDAAG